MMAWTLTVIAGLSLAIWFYLLALRGGFWRADRRLDAAPAEPEAWPAVAVLVPARDEAEVIGAAVSALLAQDYPAPFQVVVIDDHSRDATAAIAERAAAGAQAAGRLRVIAAPDLAPGWTGKLWALQCGLAHADAALPGAAYLWLSDADIEHDPATLRRLVAKAEAEGLNLVSLMVALSCNGFWERLLIPPFVYFFQMLYPFAWVNDPAKGTAAAAGGCVLLRRDALARAGGFAAIRGALIDDCALARAIKALAPTESARSETGGIWLGLATVSRSIRPYRGLGEIWRMVARNAYTQLRHSRNAYTQLRHSPLLLVGTLLAMALTFLAPPLVAVTAGIHDDGVAAFLAASAWLLMALSAVPTLRLYRQPAWLAALLPLAAVFYCAMTLDSARRHWRGRGGAWKDRVHSEPSGL
jgi:hopene-associated glycosyltransferase HpnB